MNIHRNDFVLEIGSGHNPRMRSDVLCDKFINDDTQRGGEIVADRLIVAADAQFLPFADNAFDYVICSHILEHVEDPALMISELERVASRGYIETPSELAERLYGWPYHHWMINQIGGKLKIQRKIAPSRFGQLFHALATQDKNFARFHKMNHSIFLIRYEWINKINYEILAPDTLPPLDLDSQQTIENLLNQTIQISYWKKILPIIKDLVPRQIVLRTKSIFAKRSKRSKQNLREIVVCPTCKGEVIWNDKTIQCRSCDIDYPIVGGIPDLNPIESKKLGD